CTDLASTSRTVITGPPDLSLTTSPIFQVPIPLPLSPRLVLGLRERRAGRRLCGFRRLGVPEYFGCRRSCSLRSGFVLRHDSPAFRVPQVRTPDCSRDRPEPTC